MQQFETELLSHSTFGLSCQSIRVQLASILEYDKFLTELSVLFLDATDISPPYIYR
jgi:hypothetical protein